MRKEGMDLVLQQAAQNQQLTGEEFATTGSGSAYTRCAPSRQLPSGGYQGSGYPGSAYPGRTRWCYPGGYPHAPGWHPGGELTGGMRNRVGPCSRGRRPITPGSLPRRRRSAAVAPRRPADRAPRGQRLARRELAEMTFWQRVG